MWSPEQGIEADVEKRFTGGPAELRLFAHVPLDGDEKEIDFVQFQSKPFVLATRNHRPDWSAARNLQTSDTAQPGVATPLVAHSAAKNCRATSIV